MAHKTKAEKIAAALRTKKMTAGHISPIETKQPLPQVESLKTKESGRVYDPKDILKTFSTTFFILSLMTLFYVAQLKGYIQ